MNVLMPAITRRALNLIRDRDLDHAYSRPVSPTVAGLNTFGAAMICVFVILVSVCLLFDILRLSPDRTHTA